MVDAVVSKPAAKNTNAFEANTSSVNNSKNKYHYFLSCIIYI